MSMIKENGTSLWHHGLAYTELLKNSMKFMGVNLLTILTVRTGSYRLPNKCLIDIEGRPLIAWIIERLQKLPGELVVAVPNTESDKRILSIADDMKVTTLIGSEHNVIRRMESTRSRHGQNAKFIFRALGDMPFLKTSFVAHAVEMMNREGAEAFVWATTPDHLQTIVYGAREFPYSVSAWMRINSYSVYREHVDQYFHENRDKFKIMYHEPPSNQFFRNYRLEIDYPEDIELVREIAKGPGMEAPLEEVITFLDNNPDVVAINRKRVEETGPTTYSFDTKRTWMKVMRGKPVMGWDGEWILPPSTGSVPIFCKSGRCLMGHGDGGVLYTHKGDRIVGRASLACNCGSGLIWNEPIKRSR